MKKLALVSIAVTAGLAVSAANASWFSSKPNLKSQANKVSYTMGYQMGKSMKKFGVSMNPTVLKEGMEAGLKGQKPALTQAEMQATMENFQKTMMAKAQHVQQEEGAANLKTSNAYMAKMAKQPGVKKLETGVYYKVLKSGHGPKPTATDTVTVNYAGSLPNGKVFDSSYQRHQPATFTVGQVIPGWKAALQHMPQGSTWELYIAPNQAYGQMAPPTIGPNQALTFKVHLISIKKGPVVAADHAEPTTAKH